MYLFVDTETTGKPRNWQAPVSDLGNWPRIVQLGWLECVDGGELQEVSQYIIKPDGFKIPNDVVRIHGISTERALAEGVDLKKALSEFATVLRRAKAIVAHNLNFDESVLGAEFIRAGVKGGFGKKQRICTMRAATDYCKLPGQYGYKWPTLEELYRKLFKKGLERAHEAAADIRACAECFFELKRIGVIDAASTSRARRRA